MKVVIARLDEFPAGDRRIVTVGNRSIGVFRVGDRFHALRNRCPHQGGPLCVGHVFRRAVSDQPGEVRYLDEAPMIACPWHGWEYDMETGQSYVGPGESRVKAYEVSVERGSAVAEVLRQEGERVPGPYVAETFPVRVEDAYVVLEA